LLSVCAGINGKFFFASVLFIASYFISFTQGANATDYASRINNSSWYVPDNEMSAFAAFRQKGFEKSFPVNDQTL
jgi:hypothetical protein